MTHLNNEIALTVKLEGEAFTSWDGIDEAITNRIADLFISDRKMKLADRVSSIIDARVSAIVEERVERFLQKPIPALDRFGQPIPNAPARSLSDMIADAADAAMTETVDPVDGRPKKADHYNKAVPRLEWLVKRVAISEIASACEKSVREVSAKAKAQVQAQVAAEIAARLTKL